MIHNCFSTHRPGRLRLWPWLCLLLTLLLVRAALGTDAGYTNNAYVFFDGLPGDSIPPGFNPMIDTTNFVNNGTFDMENGSVYQTWNTTNYVNNSLMESGMIVGYGGFWFDRHTPSDLWASGFYNSGEIYCQYTLKVWATNIVSPGTLAVGSSTLGSMQLYGKNVDLSRSTISMPGVSQGYGSIFGFYPTVGSITNFWYPGDYLSLPYPETPLFPVPPFGDYYISLNNPVVYAHDTGVVNSNRMVQVVYISQPNPAIANNVSFNPTLQTGNITVQFSGPYINPTTALMVTNYLTIRDNFGETTNLSLLGSFPINYTIFELRSIFTPPPPAGLPFGIYNTQPGGINLSVTNAYSFCEALLESTTVSTNNIANGALTNLPGRIQIAAAGGNLNLALASISGANYMSLTGTNQYDGIPLQIITPYTDISLGVTNGFLTITNLLSPFIPVWCGSVILWSARWSLVDTNAGFPVTNYFHVLFVDVPRLSATASAQVQDLILHGTNSIVISDALNVMRTLSIDAQNLTLTTNGYAQGATSPDGELNLEADSIFWNTSLPNLRNLTNNGVISTMNLTYFGSSASPYAAFVNHGLVFNQTASTFIDADYFENGGSFGNGGLGSFNLQSLNTMLTNGSIIAGGDVSITTSSLVTSNLVLRAGQSLTLQVTNFLTDNDETNDNIWFVGGWNLVGLNLPILPNRGDLRGTEIFMQSPTPNKQVVNKWAGQDRGVSNSGYTNNAAVGRLILDAPAANSSFKFNGTGTNNAIYVDELVLLDYASWTNHIGPNLPALAFNTNLVIYYAQAITADGGSVAERLNGANTNHLLWMWTHAGRFSSTNIVYPDGTTNGPFNAALASSSHIDSDGDGLVNGSDPTPFFVPSQLNFTKTLTNRPPLSMRLQWKTIPLATNYIYYKTNLLSTNWLPLTNFDHYYYGANVAVTNSAHVNSFVSPQPYPSSTTNVWVFDAATNGLRYYRVMVSPSWLQGM